MDLFLSWSKPRGLAMATTLRGWIPEVIQRIEPWMSSEDIDKGQRWALEVSARLEQTSHGLICVTRENMAEPWLNFEAGALSRSISSSRVRPVLLDLASGDLTGPLAQFQTTALTNREDVLRLMRSLNAVCDPPLDAGRLERAFANSWDQLDEAVRAVLKESITLADRRKGRSTDDKIDEILDLVRNIGRTVEPPAALPEALPRRGGGLIAVDLRHVDPSLGVITQRVQPDTTVRLFLNELWNAMRAGGIPAYTYGTAWALRRSGTTTLLVDMGSAWARKNGMNYDDRLLELVGLKAGMQFEVVRLNKDDAAADIQGATSNPPG